MGDTRHWKKVYTAQTTASPEKLMQIYLAAMSQHKDWRLTSDKAPHQLSWQRNTGATQWRHRFTIEAADHEDMYYLTISVEQAKAPQDT